MRVILSFWGGPATSGGGGGPSAGRFKEAAAALASVGGAIPSPATLAAPSPEGPRGGSLTLILNPPSDRCGGAAAAAAPAGTGAAAEAFPFVPPLLPRAAAAPLPPSPAPPPSPPGAIALAGEKAGSRGLQEPLSPRLFAHASNARVLKRQCEESKERDPEREQQTNERKKNELHYSKKLLASAF